MPPPSSSTSQPLRTFTVVGCGCIGAYVGGRIALSDASGGRVRFLLSPTQGKLLRAIKARGGVVLQQQGRADQVVTGASYTTDPVSALKECDCVIVATKRSANKAVRATLDAAKVPLDVPVILMQNGLDAAGDFVNGSCPRRAIFQCIVTMNVVSNRQTATFRLTSPLPKLTIDAGAEEAVLDLARRRHQDRAVMGAHATCLDESASSFIACLERAGIGVTVAASLSRCERGKLIINMFNAPNALSGRSTAQTLLLPCACRLVADSMAEAVACFRAEQKWHDSRHHGALTEPRIIAHALPIVFRLLSFSAVNFLIRALLSLIALGLGRWHLVWNGCVEELLPSDAREFCILRGRGLLFKLRLPICNVMLSTYRMIRFPPCLYVAQTRQCGKICTGSALRKQQRFPISTERLWNLVQKSE